MEKMEFRVRVNKPRRELSLPQLTFHHADHWMKVLGMEVFSAWLMIYTWCDRAQYPQDDVSHHKDIREVAQAFGCCVDKAQKIIQKLYEFGLIDIIQKKNKYGGVKNVYYWYEIPVYADSMFCELKKFRNWSDRNWHGQELAKLRKIKEEKNAITSRTEKPYGSDNTQENSELQNEPYGKTVRQPYGKSVQYNYLNNNNVVVVESPVEKCRKSNAYDQVPDHNSTELQGLVEKTCGAKIPPNLLSNLVAEFGEEKVAEKIKMLGSVVTHNAPGFLIAALRDNYVMTPGRPKICECARARPKSRGLDPVDEEARRKKKEFIKSLYLS